MNIKKLSQVADAIKPKEYLPFPTIDVTSKESIIETTKEVCKVLNINSRRAERHGDDDWSCNYEQKIAGTNFRICGAAMYGGHDVYVNKRYVPWRGFTDGGNSQLRIAKIIYYLCNSKIAKQALLDDRGLRETSITDCPQF